MPVIKDETPFGQPEAQSDRIMRLLDELPELLGVSFAGRRSGVVLEPGMIPLRESIIFSQPVRLGNGDQGEADPWSFPSGLPRNIKPLLLSNTTK